MGERFYRFMLRVERASGASDLLPVTAAGRFLPQGLAAGAFVCVAGQLRSYAGRLAPEGEPRAPRLVLTAFARSVQLCEGPCMRNELALSGRVCRPPVYRTTPLRREITDLLLVCERAYGKADALPVIAWGRNARRAAELVPGETLCLTGRLQSRDYDKLLPNGTVVVRTAYEVSMGGFERAHGADAPV